MGSKRFSQQSPTQDKKTIPFFNYPLKPKRIINLINNNNNNRGHSNLMNLSGIPQILCLPAVLPRPRRLPMKAPFIISDDEEEETAEVAVEANTRTKVELFDGWVTG